MLETPVAFLIFNRPETTRRVFAEIRKAQPKKLLIVADGPRPDRPGEAELCAEARSVVESIDWDCEVLRNYSETNLGCKYRVASGLDWVFEQCEEAIILEDDCLPSQSFFRFCEELLEKYRDDKRVMVISGDNFQFGHVRGSFSYYFSKYAHIWGWASWRRAWQLHDIEMVAWDNLKDTGWLADFLNDSNAATYWRETFNACYAGKIDTWDLGWMFTCWLNNGSTILPNVNLVRNIGFGPDASHTHTDIYGVSSLEAQEIYFPLTHPTNTIIDAEADKFTFYRLFYKEKYKTNILKKIVKSVLMRSSRINANS